MDTLVRPLVQNVKFVYIDYDIYCKCILVHLDFYAMIGRTKNVSYYSSFRCNRLVN